MDIATTRPKQPKSRFRENKIKPMTNIYLVAHSIKRVMLLRDIHFYWTFISSFV